jgi:hypothetical protein
MSPLVLLFSLFPSWRRLHIIVKSLKNWEWQVEKYLREGNGRDPEQELREARTMI